MSHPPRLWKALLVAGLVSGIVHVHAQEQQQLPRKSWDSLLVLWRNYCQTDSRPQGEELRTYLRSDGSFDLKDAERYELVLDWLTSYCLDSLCLRIGRCDTISMDIGFGLLSIAPGPLVVDIFESMGETIHTNPRFFLWSLRMNEKDAGRAARIAVYCKHSFDNPSAKRRHFQDRIDCLAAICDPELRDLKKECILEIKQHLEALFGQ